MEKVGSGMSLFSLRFSPRKRWDW